MISASLASATIQVTPISMTLVCREQPNRRRNEILIESRVLSRTVDRSRFVLLWTLKERLFKLLLFGNYRKLDYRI
jgi:hypothetical protein